ncbi:MAG: hypothetical protein N3A38_08860 [Planctomycetota bacterium]|nr:hypothetical protein [Planctomycetota bacterium]
MNGGNGEAAGEFGLCLSRARPGSIEVRRSGLAMPVFLEPCPVWDDGVRMGIPFSALRRSGSGWVAGGRLEAPSGVWEVRDILTPRGNTLAVERRWTWCGSRLVNVRFGFEAFAPFRRLDFWARPYISINGNRGSRTVPSGTGRDGRPWVFREERTTAPGLMTVESDGEIAGIYTEPGRSDREISASCMVRTKDGCALGIFFPCAEKPVTFLGAAYPGNSSIPEQGLYTCGSGWNNGLTIEGRAAIRRRFFLVLDAAGQRRHGYFRAWESAWKNLDDPIAPPVRLHRVENILWKSLGHFWFERGGACGFVVRTGADGDLLSGFTPCFEAAWCGPTMMLAWLAIRKAAKLGEPRFAEKAVKAADFYVDNAGLPGGLFRTRFDVKRMRWADRGLDAVQMGGAAYWLLRCVELLDSLSGLAPGAPSDSRSGTEGSERQQAKGCAGGSYSCRDAGRLANLSVPCRKTSAATGASAALYHIRPQVSGQALMNGKSGAAYPAGFAAGPAPARAVKALLERVAVGRWKDFALAFCDHAVRTQRPDGAFVARWEPRGGGRCGVAWRPAGFERAMGVHSARAVLEAFRVTGEDRYLQSAIRGAEYYIRACVDRECGYGDCTDILDSTTENDAAGVPDLLLDLYRETGRGRYLDRAIRAAEYCLAWMFAYNVYFPPETDCGRRGMRTRGSSAISPETAFVSFFFAPQANTFLELWRETGEERWLEYAVAVIRGTLQMLTEPGDTFGLAGHMIGCRAEVIPVLDTVKGPFVWKKGMTGYSWHQPVWWPAAFNLLNFATVEDRFPEVAKELEGRGNLR